MNKFFTIGAVLGWLLTSMISGKHLPVMSLPTILSVAIGGIVGVIFGTVYSGVKKN